MKGAPRRFEVQAGTDRQPPMPRAPASGSHLPEPPAGRDGADSTIASDLSLSRSPDLGSVAGLARRWYHTYGVRKTTVYLNDDEADALRQLAAATGVSQAELIRGAIRQVVAQVPPRQFRSLGRGQGTGAPRPRWDAAAVYDKVFAGRD